MVSTDISGGSDVIVVAVVALVDVIAVAMKMVSDTDLALVLRTKGAHVQLSTQILRWP